MSNNNDEELIHKVLGKRVIRKKIIKEYKESLDSIMMEDSVNKEERPWQSFELTQNENVNEWIENPKKIQKIQPNLEVLSKLIQVMPKPLKIADIGCYGGYIYDYLIKVAQLDKNDIEYVGIDVQEDVIKAAKLVHTDSENAQFRVGDIYKLNETFKEGEFDVVICSRVLIHIPFFEKAIGNLVYITKHLTFCVLEISKEPLLQKIHRHVVDSDLELDYFFRKYSEEELVSISSKLNVGYRINKGPDIYSSFYMTKERN